METIKQLSSGNTSIASLIGTTVIRRPNTGTDVTKWLNDAAKECIITKQLQQTKCIVPQATLDESTCTLTSAFFDGNPLTEQIYTSLPPEQQENISSDFADFLYKLHHIKESTAFSDDYYTSDKFKKKIKDISLPADLQNMLNTAVNAIANNDKVSKQVGLCHNDLIKDNILFNKEQNKLGIIDFGDANFASVYRDFGSLCRPSQIGIKFTQDVVSKYNQICEKEKQPVIDFMLVKQVAILRTFEKLHYYTGTELALKFDQLRDLQSKLFPKATINTTEKAIIARHEKNGTL